MASKLLNFIRNFNQPLEKFVVKNGWNFRLFKKRLKGNKFKKLTRDEKRAVRRYWRNYGRRVSPAWAAYYSAISGKFDPRYIPESLYYSEFLQKLGATRLGALNHKNIQEQIFSSKQPRTIVHKNESLLTDADHRPLTLAAALAACRAEDRVIIKPATGSYGRGIEFWSAEDADEKLETALNSADSLVIQEVLEAHPFFADIHPNSLNTLRLVTLIIDNEPVLLSCIMRMGHSGSQVDNTSAGGVIAVVDENGYLHDNAIQKDQNIISQHPHGFVYKGQRVPHFDRVLEDVYTQCWRLPYFRLVFWDYAVDRAGDPVLIEANFPAGQIESHQFNNGPLFGEYTDRVLDFIYNDKLL